MKRKKILLCSYMIGNMEALKAYYDSNLKNQYDEKLAIEFLDMRRIDKMMKMPRYVFKFLERMKRYDLVVSDYSSPILKTGKKVIFMDHGYGVKNMPGKDEIQNLKVQELIKLFRERVDYVVTLSERDEEYFYRSEEFEKLPLPKYIPLGQPRNDVLFEKAYRENARKDIMSKLNMDDEVKLMLYAPTWRGYESCKLFPFTREDFINLNEYLGKRKYKFLYRPHYIETIIDPKLIEGLENMIVLDVDKEPDTQKILAAVDLLITDYSSIFVDYLIMNKPIAFMPYDLDKYLNFRGLVVDYGNDSHTPGPKIKNVDELIRYIDCIENNDDDFEKIREKAIKYYFKHFDSNSCKRVWELMLNEV